MGECSPMQFEGITRQRFTCLQQAAAQQVSVAIDTDSGSASSGDGSLSIMWTFNEATGVLTLQCTKTPYPCFLVSSRLKSFVASCP